MKFSLELNDICKQ